MQKKINKLKGFYKNKKTGHPSYPFWQKQKKVKSIGFTHNVNSKDLKEKLQCNIDPKDNSSCYVKTEIENQSYNDYKYEPKYKDYRFHKKDKPLINTIINKDKKRR